MLKTTEIQSTPDFRRHCGMGTCQQSHQLSCRYDQACPYRDCSVAACRMICPSYWELCVGDITATVIHIEWLKVIFQTLRARCTNVIHDLGSAEPRWKVESSSRSIILHQVELKSDDPIQLNDHGYTVVVADWSTTLCLCANYSDVTVTRNAFETIQYWLAVICSNFKFPWKYHTIFASTVAW